MRCIYVGKRTHRRGYPRMLPMLAMPAVCLEQTCYQSCQSDINQAAAQIWQAGALSLT
jgi:hypothetical protein